MAQQDIYISYDDVNHTITIKTPGGNMIELSDKNQTIVLRDQHANAVVLSSSGIDISTAANININAGQNINLKAGIGINIDATLYATVNTMDLKLKADSQASLQGGLMLNLAGGTEATLKAAMVMIN